MDEWNVLTEFEGLVVDCCPICEQPAVFTEKIRQPYNVPWRDYNQTIVRYYQISCTQCDIATKEVQVEDGKDNQAVKDMLLKWNTRTSLRHSPVVKYITAPGSVKVRCVFFFDDGMMACTDQYGQQVPTYQGRATSMAVKYLVS